MIWFGIFLVIVVEMAQITPPVGFNLFVLQVWPIKIWVILHEVHFHCFVNGISSNTCSDFSEIALWMPEQMVKNLN